MIIYELDKEEYALIDAWLSNRSGKAHERCVTHPGDIVKTLAMTLAGLYA